MRGHQFQVKRWVGLAALLAGMQLAPVVRGAQFSEIVSFGDSLSDVGNFYTATGGLSPPTAWGYAPGVFTNGLNWVQYLAQDLGIAVPTASLNGGTDYAYGSAQTGMGTTQGGFYAADGSTVPLTVPNVDQQIADYLAVHTPAAGQLYTVWGGANDLLYNMSPDPLGAAGNIANGIKTLLQAGAGQVLVGNLPLLGETPIIKDNQPPAVQQGLDAMSVAFNKELASDLAQLSSLYPGQVHLFDVYSLMNDAMANPSKYGFTDVNDPQFGHALPSSTGFLSWDGLHPTTQADQFIGGLAAQSVPEPSSLVLLATAVMAVAGCCGRCLRRRASAGACAA